MIIWEESYLQTLLKDSERAIVNDVDYIFFRFSLAVEAGKSVYSLPRFVRGIERVTYQGYKVWPISPREMNDLYPAAAFVSDAVRVEPPSSRPRFYCIDAVTSIRFYPSPSSTIPANDINIYGSGADDKVVISCWRSPYPANPDLTLPTYIGRRLRKYWALGQAFEKEGKGQNLKAAVYFKKRYQDSVSKFRDINRGVFTAKKQRLAEILQTMGAKPHRPILPPQYGQ